MLSGLRKDKWDVGELMKKGYVTTERKERMKGGSRGSILRQARNLVESGNCTKKTAMLRIS